MKFILTIYICSAIAQQCGPPIIKPIEYNNWKECALNGYKESILILNEHSIDEVNKYKMMINFICKKQPGKDT